MPSVPPPCQALADNVSVLDAREQSLRAQAATLVGPAAWAALAELGQVRLQLDDARVALDQCVRQHSATLQVSLAVIYDGGMPASPRTATLWEMTNGGGALQQDAAPLVNESFIFTEPLPPSFAVTVGPTGDGTPTGCDFRSPALFPDQVPADGTLRLEIVRGPTIRWRQSDVARLAAAFSPTTSQFSGPGGQLRLDVQRVDATLSDAGIRARAWGQITVTALGVPQSGPFTASATLHVVGTTSPGTADPVSVSPITDLELQLPPLVGGLLGPMASLVHDQLSSQLTTQVRAFFRAELPVAIGRTFALTTLPPGAVVSVSNVVLDATAMQFEPAIGVIGTALSTYSPSVLPP